MHPALHLPEGIRIVRVTYGGLHQVDAGFEQAQSGTLHRRTASF